MAEAESERMGTPSKTWRSDTNRRDEIDGIEESHSDE
jgi:hypothetical protein